MTVESYCIDTALLPLSSWVANPASDSDRAFDGWKGPLNRPLASIEGAGLERGGVVEVRRRITDDDRLGGPRRFERTRCRIDRVHVERRHGIVVPDPVAQAAGSAAAG